MSFNGNDYLTKSQILGMRKKLDETYTFNPRIGKTPKRVLSPRRQAATEMPFLNIDTDLEKARREAEGIVKVRSPKPIHRQLYYDRKEQANRLMRVKCGQPISRVFHDENPTQWKLQEFPKTEILTEKESITPSRKYVVPQMDPPIGFYNKHPHPDTPMSDLAMNRLKGILFSINESINKGFCK